MEDEYTEPKINFKFISKTKEQYHIKPTNGDVCGACVYIASYNFVINDNEIKVDMYFCGTRNRIYTTFVPGINLASRTACIFLESGVWVKTEDYEPQIYPRDHNIIDYPCIAPLKYLRQDIEQELCAYLGN